MIRVVFSTRVFADVVAIRDECDPRSPTMSVTNAAEHVVQLLAREGLITPDRRVIYRDTQGFWDELVVEDGRFVRFALIGARSLDDAVLAVRKAAGRA